MFFPFFWENYFFFISFVSPIFDKKKKEGGGGGFKTFPCIYDSADGCWLVLYFVILDSSLNQLDQFILHVLARHLED